jgi:hydroxypyruvate reductase
MISFDNARPTDIDAVTQRMREEAREIFHAGLNAVAPVDAMLRHCRCEKDRFIAGDSSYDLNDIERIYVVGAGKATAAMAQAIETLLGDRIDDGVISVKYEHTAPLKKIRTIEAGHPLPDANGMAAAQAMLAMAQQATEADLIICLLSGGGSALLPLPVTGTSLEEKQKASDVLIACGATIHEINAIRKHLSVIKGGQLAQAAAPAQVVSLILSDVVGDDLDVIASGPTVPDASTYSDCMDIIDRYGIGQQMPHSIMDRLQAGKAGKIDETPKADSHAWQHSYIRVVGSNLEAILASQALARKKGYQTVVLSSRIEGETRVVAQVHGSIAREILASGHPVPPPACILSGGETTVTIAGEGKGGRNQEFALAAALDIAGCERIVLLSGGTDGTDGPTDAAGAIVDHLTAARARQAGLELRQHLDQNNAYPFFKSLDDLLITGPTFTNVMDMRIILVR